MHVPKLHNALSDIAFTWTTYFCKYCHAWCLGTARASPTRYQLRTSMESIARDTFCCFEDLLKILPAHALLNSASSVEFAYVGRRLTAPSQLEPRYGCMQGRSHCSSDCSVFLPSEILQRSLRLVCRPKGLFWRDGAAGGLRRIRHPCRQLLGSWPMITKARRHLRVP